MADKKFIDYYDVLMVSPEADRPMIEWAVRLMLTRYGKKDGQEPQTDKIQLVKEAYQTLADPTRRAAFDAERVERASNVTALAPAASAASSASGEYNLSLETIQVKQTATVDDVLLQRQIRAAVVSSLYDVYITDPRTPELGRADIARATQVKTDDLEFALWYLRERGYMRTTREGAYALTGDGVDYVEQGGVEHLSITESDEGYPARRGPARAAGGSALRSVR